jgi:Domain of unknown function (DUF4861)
MNLSSKTLILSLALALPGLCLGAGEQLTVKAVNALDFARPSQTLELTAKDLAPLKEQSLNKIHVTDDAGKEVLCQAVDLDGDHVPDEVIFQADFAPGETKTFHVSAGKKQIYKKEDFRAYGRFVRERFDDFAWENDRIAHRMYGKALETWKGEPLTSSAVDVWVKHVPYMVIDGWYMVDNYHADTGEGADFYPAGTTRGNGGNGLWADEKLSVSKNFVDSRVLANGPIRVMFELVYEPFEVNGTMVAEVKRISLDAGQNLDHYCSFYKPAGAVSLTNGIGIKKIDVVKHDADTAGGTLTTWEPLKQDKQKSFLGSAIVVDPKLWVKAAEDKLNILVLAQVPPDNTASYWAGFGWTRSGQFAGYEAWKAYVNHFARGLESPIKVEVVNHE